MATDGPDPAPCNDKIFKKGESVAVLTGSSNAVERWVQSVAKRANAKVDWHYSGGLANVLHLGNKKSRNRVFEAINDLQNQVPGRLLQVGGPGLYRAGVTPVPKGVIAVDPVLGIIVKVKKGKKK